MATYKQGKSMCIAYVFWFFLGIFGAHRFYLERWCTAVLWLLTGGLLGIGWLVDLCVLPCMVNSYNSIVYKTNANASMNSSGAMGGQSQVLNISISTGSTSAPPV